MAGRHQAPYPRYPNAGASYGSSNMGNNNMSNNNNLNIPFPPQNNGSMAGSSGSSSGGVNGPYSSAPGSSYSTTPTNTTSPYSTASSPGYHSPNVTKSQHNLPLKKYVLQPPLKLLPYCKATPSLGYPGLFPQRPNQEEDVMSESNMRNGFIEKSLVSNEQTCAHDIIYGKLQDDRRLLNEMGNFMVDVLKRKKKASRITGPSSFKPPTRTTLMELKKEHWIQELANGAVPLRTLSRNVPHGYKGEKLLETLAARQVPFLRATWYIKVVGLSEMAQRNASNSASNSSHAYNWTMIVTGHLKKQLADLVPLPSNSASGSMRGHRNSNVPGVGGVNNDNQVKPWTTSETKARFESRWSYSSKLTRWQYSEGLLDQRNFLKWTLDTLATSGSFEIMWVVLTGIIQDYIDEYRRNRTLTKLLVETLIKAYSAVLQCSKFPTTDTTTSATSNSSNMLTGLKRDIERMIQSLFLSSPDMFVIPKLYHQYRQLFEVILGEQSHIKLTKTVPDICIVMDTYWTMVKARNEVFCGTLEENRLGNSSNNHNMIESSTSKSAATPITNTSADLANSESSKSGHKGNIGTTEGAAVDEEHIVHTLDSIGRYADSGYLLFGNNNTGWTDEKGHSAMTASLVIFSGCTNGSTVHTNLLNQVVQILCRWATCEARHGDWRAFLISSVLLCWRDQDQTTQFKRQGGLQEALMEFLDNQVFTTSRMASTTDTMAAGEDENQGASTTSMIIDGGSGIMDGDQTATEQSSTAAISFLYDTFIRMQLFSYHRYLNRLTARGHLERSQRNRSDVARCLYHLKSLPLLTPAPAHLVNQRRVALYGTRRDNDNESRLELDAIAQLRQLAKQWIMGHATGQQNSTDDTTLFGVNAEDMTEPMVNDTADTFELSLSDKLEQQMRRLMDNSTRYVIIQFTSEWLLNEVKRFVVKNVQIGEDNWRVMTSPGSCLLNARQYVALIKILECAKDYMNVVQLALWVLEKTNERSVLALVIDTLRQYANIWKLMNSGNLVAKTLWDKHQSLQARGIRERCVMIYMVQLIQEGYSVTDDMRLQLQKDLQMRPRVRGRHVQVSIGDELLQVIDNDASKSYVQNAVENLCAAYQYQNGALWVGLVLDGVVDTMQQWIKKTAMYGSSDQGQHHQQQQQQNLTLQRYLCSFADIIKDIADMCTLTGQINDALIDWLSNKASVVEEMRQPQSWLVLFIAHLVSRNLVSLDVIFYRFTLPWFDQVSQHFLRDDALWSTTASTTTADGTSANTGTSSNGSTTDDNANSNQWHHICENMMILIRLLVVQERCYWIQQDGNAMNEVSGAYQQPWVLPADEVFRLETLRYTQLASSLDRIEPMFALMEKLVLIASSLPLSSPLLQELVMLRADLLQIGWFRQACVRDLHGVYRRFSSHGTEASTEKKIKKKILSIVDELIGGTLADMSPGHHHHHHLHHATLVQEPDFIDKIQRIFINVSQWNEEQCRVQVSLLLDNILLSDGGNGQNPNNPHILGGDDITMTNSNDKLEHGDEGGFLVMKRNNNKDLDAFVRFFFSVVLSNEDQQQRRSLFFKNVIHGLRKRVLLELLNYGVRLLEGCDIDANDESLQQDHSSATSPPASQQQQQRVQSPDQNMSSSSSASPPILSSTGNQQQQRISATSTPSPAHHSSLKSFPNNVLLLSSVNECFDSAKYAYKSQAFLNIMQHMMAQNMWGNDKKIDLVKTLYRQIKRFQSGLLAYQVMQDAHTTFAKAVSALDATKNNVASAVSLLATEGLSPEPTDLSVTLDDLRTSLLIRIRLMVPFASLIWEYPKEDECDALSWIWTLVILLGNPIVHGNGSQEQFFEFVLDFVSLIIDEVPPVIRKQTLARLSTLPGEPTTVPAMFQSRVNRILPFSTHNIYLTNSRLATGILGATPTTDPLQQQQHLETCMEQSRPWEWLEDYVSDPPHDNDVPINLGLFRARKSRRMDGTYIRCRT
ncbi:hypothetical protein BCR42DRAFT_343237 [Absidia repens]|uniref:Mediator of RNA polymerase II transcription subunit 12 n=1 Tax=Absidia repens TaxID=90262 RepID=A0A1X2IZP0_9FUNG|nr:hypothetical protein BCR42DRAFT_343237 [Absidia repens]